jgi:hypothetical protein
MVTGFGMLFISFIVYCFNSSDDFWLIILDP